MFLEIKDPKNYEKISDMPPSRKKIMEYEKSLLDNHKRYLFLN